MRFALAILGFIGLFGGGSVEAATALPYQVYSNPKRIDASVFEDEHYNHAAAVAQYGSRVYVAWNGNRHNIAEGQAGQVIMLSTSDDGGRHWSSPILPFVREYRASDTRLKQVVDAAPGNADDNHKVRYAGANAIQWQPSLTVFRNKLLMFWTVGRFTEGAALLMSELEPDGQQWRTKELHFKEDGTPYFLAQINSQAPVTSDPPVLSADAAARYVKIVGAQEAIPGQIRLADVSAKLLMAEGAVPGIINLAAQKFVLSPNQATVVKDKDSNDVLVVSCILLQTAVDWSIAVKIPALLTTTDGERWQLSLVPIPVGEKGLLSDERGDIGIISAWEPTTVVDRRGDFQMLMRLLLPPKTATNLIPVGTGFRVANASGRYEPGVGVHWSPVRLSNIDIPSTRSGTARIVQQDRWVMVANHYPQNVVYEGNIPKFKYEKSDLWSRNNMELFFSTRGEDDYLAGINISGNIADPGKEIVHYPVVQSASVGGKGGDMLVAYSTHRRETSCTRFGGEERACHDSIQFSRIMELPDPKRPAIYPNQLARYFSFGKSVPQEQSFRFVNNVLTLHDRASAGIETWGSSGCVKLRFQLDGVLPLNDERPILSFGRTPNRAAPIGLVVRNVGGNIQGVLGKKMLALSPDSDGWMSTRVCYDYGSGKLSANGVEYDLGPGKLLKQSYLGDPTIARHDRVLPDLHLDISAMTLEVLVSGDNP